MCSCIGYLACGSSHVSTYTISSASTGLANPGQLVQQQQQQRRVTHHLGHQSQLQSMQQPVTMSWVSEEAQQPAHSAAAAT